jgi:hypothetical protein
VLDPARAVGIVILFADPETPLEPTRRYFSVRNTLHQELGSIDALGRAWLFVPHEREALLLGASTLVEGACKILDAGADARLVELPISELKGGGRPPERAEESLGAMTTSSTTTADAASLASEALTQRTPRVGNDARPMPL